MDLPEIAIHIRRTTIACLIAVLEDDEQAIRLLLTGNPDNGEIAVCVAVCLADHIEQTHRHAMIGELREKLRDFTDIA